MNSASRTSYFPSTAFEGYTVGSDDSFDLSQQPYYGSNGTSTSGSLPHNRQSHDKSLDLSHFHVLARNSVNQVPMHDVIKPEEALPWVGAQPNSANHRQSNLSTYASNTYSRSEPGFKLDIISDAADSGYQSQAATAGISTYNNFSLDRRELEQSHQNLFTTASAVNNFDAKSIASEGYLTGQKDAKRGAPLTPCQWPGCTKQPKNHSDAKKHWLTHTKPFCCTERNCGRKEGFATVNDLERHRKSVHNLQPNVGSTVGYICAACPIPDGTQRKFWPRKDNFKAHVKRRHINHNVEQILDMSKQTTRPDDAQTADDDARTVRSAMQSAAHHSQVDPDEDRTHQHINSPSMMRHLSEQSHYSSNNVFWPHTPPGIYNGEDTLVGMQGHTVDLQRYPNMSAGDSGLLSPLTNSIDNVDFTGSFSYPQTSKRMRPSPSEANHPQQGQSPAHLMIPELRLVSGTSDPQSSSSAGVVGEGEGDFQCPVCHKRRKRECDLKKHIKRHTRPYGCTFPHCHKRFGSRNDWKRHESHQHYLQEMWKCQRPLVQNNEPCSRRPMHHLEILKKHLSGPEHRMTDVWEIEEECKRSRLGREGNENFWCGFCKRLVNQHETSLKLQRLDDELEDEPRRFPNAFEARFQHIGDHFDKDNRVIDEWVCVEENKQKRFITLDDRKRAKYRARTGYRDDANAIEEEEGLPEYDMAAPAVNGYQQHPQQGYSVHMTGAGMMPGSGSGLAKKRKVDVEDGGW